GVFFMPPFTTRGWTNTVQPAEFPKGIRFSLNYCHGVRRYPYSHDMTKNPLTFNDIDPSQRDNCASGAPYSPLAVSLQGSCEDALADEWHNVGEVWCVTLWEARRNLIGKYGQPVGNQLILQLVTDGMNLCPLNPTFIQARDAILQADIVNNCGENWFELWAAFVKRGMGWFASGPPSRTTTGIAESFAAPPCAPNPCQD
ncbi:MAG: M36 family metallopeptidase, partial [Verrucomicrobia bacterium]|nr:M36 family metallopeptidase [Verrucomicrobiota bacterium]